MSQRRTQPPFIIQNHLPHPPAFWQSSAKAGALPPLPMLLLWLLLAPMPPLWRSASADADADAEAEAAQPKPWCVVVGGCICMHTGREVNQRRNRSPSTRPSEDTTLLI